MRSERGQTNVEWLAVMATVVALGLAALVVGPSVAPDIVCKVRTAIASVSGLSVACGADGGEQAALPPCVVTDRNGELKAAVTIVIVKGGAKVKLTKQRLSDGTWAITAVGGGQLGVEVGSPGAKVAIDTGKDSAGGGAGAEAGGGLGGEYGAKWIFEDEKGADRQIDILRNRLRDTAAESALPWPLSAGYDHFVADDRPLGDPDVEYLQGGTYGTAKGEAKGLGGIDLKFDGAQNLGIEWNHRTGERRVYFKLDAKGGGAFKALQKLGLDVAGQAQIAVTVDREGTPIRASVLTQVGTAGNVPSFLPPDVAKTVKANLTAGGRLDADLHLDLRDPANAAAFAAFRANPLAGGDDLADALIDRGRVQLRTYRTDSEKYGIDANVKFGAKLGLEGGYEGTSADLTGAWEYDRAGGLRESVSCKAA